MVYTTKKESQEELDDLWAEATEIVNELRDGVYHQKRD